MPTVDVCEIKVPRGAEGINGSFDLPRVPSVGECIDFASNVKEDAERIVALVEKVTYSEDENGKGAFKAGIEVSRKRPRTLRAF